MSAAVDVRIGEQAIPLVHGRLTYARGLSDGWAVIPPMPIDKWADSYRKLPRESSAEHGDWHTSRNPNLLEPMQCLDASHPCQRVVLKFGTQSGKTEIGLNFLGASIHQDPGPIIVTYPDFGMGQRWVRQRFNPMVRLSPELSQRVTPPRSKDGGNTATMKEFTGGFLVIGSAAAAASLSSTPVKKAFSDEVDRWLDDVDNEGHGLDIVDRRLASYRRRKHLIASSPTVKDESVVDDEFTNSDQRHRYVPCPHCDHMHILRNENLTDDGQFMCPDCGSLIEEKHKDAMLENAEWRAHNPGHKVPGFMLPSYYTPVGLGYTWKEISEDRAKTKDKPERWKVHVNTIMAEVYEDESGKVDWKEVRDRAGKHISRVIPEGCLMLTAGVDIQDDRFAVVIIGWGRDNRIWVVDWFEEPFDPALDAEWKKLDRKVLDVEFVNRYGVTMSPLVIAVDTGGHHTQMAYNYTRTRQHRRVIGIKGSKYPNKPIIAGRPSKVDIKLGGGVLKGGAELWYVGTDTAKGSIFGKLYHDAKTVAEAANDSEYCLICNFPKDLPDDFYQQLTAERYCTETHRWIKSRHKRNEALDCVVYAFAAANHPSVRINQLRERDWQKIEEVIQPRIKDMFASASAVTDEHRQPKAASNDEAQPAAPAQEVRLEKTPTRTARRKKPKSWLSKRRQA